MQQEHPARSGRWCGAGAGTQQEPQSGFAIPSVPHLVQVRKRGRVCTLAKVVYTHTLRERVLASVYRDPERPTPTVVSLPPAVLEHAKLVGCRRWVVRLDGVGQAWAIDIDVVLRDGWLKQSDGALERFVPLDRFTPIGWVDWEYLPSDGPAAVLEPGAGTTPQPREGRQLFLFDVLGREAGDAV